MAPAAGRGRGRGRARGRGRGRGRGRAAKTPPPAAEAEAEAAPEEAPDAAEQGQEQEEQQLTHANDASAGRETIEISDSSDASPQPCASPDANQGSTTVVDQKIKEEPGSATVGQKADEPSEADKPSATSDDELLQHQQQEMEVEVEGGEPHDTATEEQLVPPQQEAAAHTNKQAVQSEEAEVTEQESGKADDDDVAAKSAAAAQSASDDAQKKQDSQADPLHHGEMVAAQSAATDNNAENKQDPLPQGQMDPEQEEEEEEEEDPEEVIFEESVSVGEGQAATEVKQGEDRASARAAEDDRQAAAESKEEEEHIARTAGQAAGKVKEEGHRARATEEDERKVMSDMAKNRQRKKELEIFVGGLDREAVEEDIRKVFAQVGDVVEVRLHKDLSTNKNKGFAFVRFANKEQVARALAEMKNPMIHGKRCGVAASEDNDTLFLGNICNTWTKEAIKKRLLDYGVEGVQSLTLVPDTQNEGQSRGFAFLEFSRHADAMLAFKRLQQPDALFGHPERTAKVAFAEPIKEADAEVMAQVKSVFIDGLPPYWDEERVKNRFKAYGLIERVVLARNMSSAKRNDFGFVNFSTHEEAIACIEATNNTELGDDGKAKLKVRVRLSNPLPKSQAVKGEMSGGFRIGHPGSGFNRPGRGFNRGRGAPRREGFHGDRGFNNHTPGRGGRFNSAYSNNNFEASPSDFRARQAPPPFRGGRWEPSSGRHDFFDRGEGRGYLPPRGPTFEPEGDFGGPFGENPYFHEDVRHSAKRPYSHMEPGPAGYFEPGPPRVRPRFDHYEQPPFPGGNRFGHYDQPPFPGGDRHRDSFGTRGGYSRDYYGHGHGPGPAPAPAPAPAPPPAQYGRGSFRPHHRGGHSGGGYYH